MNHPEYILTLSCHDQRGIVHRVSGFLAEHGCNIIDSAQFGDASRRILVFHRGMADVVADAHVPADRIRRVPFRKAGDAGERCSGRVGE